MYKCLIKNKAFSKLFSTRVIKILKLDFQQKKKQKQKQHKTLILIVCRVNLFLGSPGCFFGMIENVRKCFVNGAFPFLVLKEHVGTFYENDQTISLK